MAGAVCGAHERASLAGVPETRALARHAACCWTLEPTAQRKEGLEIKVGGWWLSLTDAGLVGQRMRRLELMTCHQCESHRHEQEGQNRIFRHSEFLDRSIQYTSTMQVWRA